MRYCIFQLSLIISSICLAQNARIIDLKTTYDLKSYEKVEITETRKVLILNEKGLRHGILFDYYDQFRKIKSASVRILDTNGKKIKSFSKSDGSEYGWNASYEINDSKRFVLNPGYKIFPHVAELTRTIVVDGFISLPDWLPQNDFNLAVDKATLEILAAQEEEIRAKDQSIDSVYVSTTDDGRKKYTYSVKSLDGVKNDVSYREFFKIMPRVQISPARFQLDGVEGEMTSWKSFGNWFYHLNNEPYVLNEETKSFLNSTSGLSESERIREVYNYMQDKTRYISIQLGIGGFKSMKTSEVEEFGYGDCKALTTYMKNMLDYVDIESNYILVRAGASAPDVVEEFPSNQFNHVFLGVPFENDTTYLECTSQMLPFGFSGSFTDDRNVLWIEKDQSQIIRSPVYDKEDNVQTNKMTVKFTAQNEVELKLSRKSEGIFFEDYLTYEYAGEDIIERKNKNQFEFKDFTIENFDFNLDNRNSDQLNTEYVVKTRNLGKKVGSDKLLIPLLYGKSIDSYINNNKSKSFCEIRRAMTIVDKVEVELPSNYWAKNLPIDSREESEFGIFELKVVADGSKKVIIERKIQLEKGYYLNEEFVSFNDFLKKIKKIDKKRLVLNSET